MRGGTHRVSSSSPLQEPERVFLLKACRLSGLVSKEALLNRPCEAHKHRHQTSSTFIPACHPASTGDANTGTLPKCVQQALLQRASPDLQQPTAAPDTPFGRSGKTSFPATRAFAGNHSTSAYCPWSARQSGAFGRRFAMFELGQRHEKSMPARSLLIHRHDTAVGTFDRREDYCGSRSAACLSNAGTSFDSATMPGI